MKNPWKGGILPGDILPQVPYIHSRDSACMQAKHVAKHAQTDFHMCGFQRVIMQITTLRALSNVTVQYMAHDWTISRY